MEAISELASAMNRFLGGRTRRRRAGEEQGNSAPGQRRAQSPTPDALVERYREQVYAYAQRRVNSRAAAEDITADVFMAAFLALDRCPPLPAMEPVASAGSAADVARAWLLGIARRKVADHCRRRARGRETSLSDLSDDAATAAAAAAAPTFPIDVNLQPEASALRAEAAQTIRQLVDALKAEYREVLLLKYVEGFSLAEIALLLGRSEAAVSSLLQRARTAALAQGRDYFLASSSIDTAPPYPSTSSEDERTKTP